ncbi:MAG: DUF4332 domain-containing protein [Myxococcota bacterium]|nr:DUF4332 domain-containing protein [Myxococcota bacterium]
MASEKIEEIEGIGPAYAERLRASGCAHADTLLERGWSKKGRQELCEESRISEKQILRWVNVADLLRIDGIGPEYAELLEASGVDSVPELALRNTATLTERCADTNAARTLTRKIPTAAQVENWIKQAVELGHKIEY